MRKRLLSAGALGALVTGGMIAATLAPTAAVAAGTPTVAVTPFAGLDLANPTSVSVTATNFPASSTIYFIECSVKALSSQSASDCDTATLQPETTDATGAVTDNFSVLSSGYSDTDAAGSNTCDQFHPCMVVGLDSGLVPQADAQVYFGPTVLGHGSPDASSLSGLKNKQNVSLDMFAYTDAGPSGNGDKLYVAECDKTALSHVSNPSAALGYCDLSTAHSYTPDASGDATNQSYPITAGNAYADNNGGKCDFKNSCVLVAAALNISTYQIDQFNVLPISFASSVVTKKTTHTALKPATTKAKAGRKVAVTATTKPTSGGEGAFGGKLVVTDNGKKIASFTEPRSGTVKFKVKLHKGKNKVVAKYSGNKYFTASSGKTTLTGK